MNDREKEKTRNGILSTLSDLISNKMQRFIAEGMGVLNTLIVAD